MKVLEKGNWKEEWKFVFNCKECGAKLEAEVADVKVGYFGGSYCEDGNREYYVSCPECDTNMFVPKELLRALVKKEADKKEKR